MVGAILFYVGLWYCDTLWAAQPLFTIACLCGILNKLNVLCEELKIFVALVVLIGLYWCINAFIIALVLDWCGKGDVILKILLILVRLVLVDLTLASILSRSQLRQGGGLGGTGDSHRITTELVYMSPS